MMKPLMPLQIKNDISGVTYSKFIFGLLCLAKMLVIFIATLLLSACTKQPTYRVLFEDLTEESRIIYIMSPDSNDEREIARAPAYSFILPSPDGTKVAILQLSRWVPPSEPNPGSLEVIATSNGKTIGKLEDVGIISGSDSIPMGENVAWSPDGTKLVLEIIRTQSEGSGTDVLVYDLTTDKVIQITSDTDIERSPTWSPDGQRIAFATQQQGEGPWRIVTIESDGTNRHVAADMGTGNFQQGREAWQRVICHLIWSPKADYIAFEDGCYPTGSGYKELFVARLNDSKIFQLTQFSESLTDSAFLSYIPRWSASGNTLLLAYSIEPWSPSGNQLHQAGVIEFETTTFTVVNSFTVPDGLSANLAGWSPDGRLFAWFQSEPKRATIVTEIVDKSLQVSEISSQLPNGICAAPQWSPDGKYLAYVRSEQGDSVYCPSETQRNVVIASISVGDAVTTFEKCTRECHILGWMTER